MLIKTGTGSATVNGIKTIRISSSAVAGRYEGTINNIHSSIRKAIHSCELVHTSGRSVLAVDGTSGRMRVIHNDRAYGVLASISDYVNNASSTLASGYSSLVYVCDMNVEAMPHIEDAIIGEAIVDGLGVGSDDEVYATYSDRITELLTIGERHEQE